MVCRSNEFIIGSEKALELGINEFNEEIKKLVSQNEFLGECYLRVLDRAEDNFENVFWYFYIFYIIRQYLLLSLLSQPYAQYYQIKFL